MHPLHDYVAKQLADKLKSRRVVVWYDERGDFQPFVDELRGGPRAGSEPASVSVAGASARLAEYAGSMFELRAVVEPHVSADAAATVVIYMPNVVRDRKASVLMELEKAGTTWEPQLKQLAKNVLLQKYTIGVVDEMLPYERKVSYDDLARAVSGGKGSEPPSLLKGIVQGDPLVGWLANASFDEAIADKDAVGELVKLVRSRLGLELSTAAPLDKLRSITVRHLLAAEFAADLHCAPPDSVASLALPTTKDEQEAAKDTARRIRQHHAEAYVLLADTVERELRLASAQLDADALGSIDTFRFEERALLAHCGTLIARREFTRALTIIAEREESFWLARDLARKAQWEACRCMAELGEAALSVRHALDKPPAGAAAWVDAYTAHAGFYRLDQAQRRLEALIASLGDQDAEEQALAVVRGLYDEACHRMAVGFLKALSGSGWSVPGVLRQDQVYDDIIAASPKPVAYFLVDAMRFEMGAELIERLPKVAEVSLRPAICGLPSITPVGMGGLMPRASASFSVVEQKGKLGVVIDQEFLPDVTARKKFAKARVPTLVDVGLDELLTMQASKLSKRIEGAEVIIVRSQEIDFAGEAGFTLQARRIMDHVITDLASAVQKLARAGVQHSVVAADHGHLFFATERDESMRADPPGGKAVELHRRCWVGRGGATPPGCTRVTAASLGYASDLDVVFPPGTGVFRAGGDLAFYHGGPSLQELVIPVLTVRLKLRESKAPAADIFNVTGIPDAVTNRIFSVVVQLGKGNLSLFAESAPVRATLTSGGRDVGTLEMCIPKDDFDRDRGTLALTAGNPVTLGFMLRDDTVKALRIALFDAATDAELYRSPEIPVRLGV